MGPKGENSAARVAVVVLYGMFLTRIVVGERGPRTVNDLISTPSYFKEPRQLL
jgi:hypothetical protein